MTGECETVIVTSSDTPLQCRHECGVEFLATAKHAGVWICELERYHAGFSRRYGEIRYGQVSVSVASNR